MATTTKIHVSRCDNELYLIAVPAGGIGSFQIFHMTSGFNNPVSYDVIPQSILPAGAYTLVLIGINWGGPQGFTVTLTTGGMANNVTFGAGTAVGATSVSVPMTV